MVIFPKKITRFLRKFLSWLVLIAFWTNTTLPAYAQGAIDFFALGSVVVPSQGFEPMVLKGVKVYAHQPFRFDFIIDNVEPGIKDEQLKNEANKLIKYFLAALTVPEEDIWVNLSPYEKDRIIPEAISQTEMGRDMLAQDYLLKQLTASLLSPDEKLGQEFWQRVNAKAKAKFGIWQLPVSTLNKVWIVPDQAVVYENTDAAFVTQSHLKVMLEEEYVAMSNQKDIAESRAPVWDEASGTAEAMQKTNVGNGRDPSLQKTALSSVSAQILRELIIPELEKEVNEGKNFASLRQMFYSMILAVWYKQALKESILSQVYANQSKVAGIESHDKQMKERIYAQYVESFKKGVFNFIREEYDESTQEIVPRKYFSGGVAGQISPILQNNGLETDAKIGSSALFIAARVDSASSPINQDAKFIRAGNRIVAKMFPDRLVNEFLQDPFVLDLNERFPDLFYWYVLLTKFSLDTTTLKESDQSKTFQLESLIDYAQKFINNEEKESLVVEILTKHIFHYQAVDVYSPKSIGNQKPNYLIMRDLVRRLVADGSASFVRKLVNATDTDGLVTGKNSPIIHGIAYQMASGAQPEKRKLAEQLMRQVVDATKNRRIGFSYLETYLKDPDIAFVHLLKELQDLMIQAFEKENKNKSLLEPIGFRMFSHEDFTFDVRALEQLYRMSKRSEPILHRYIFVLLAQKYWQEQRRMLGHGQSVQQILDEKKETDELQKVYLAAYSINLVWKRFSSLIMPMYQFYQRSNDPEKERRVNDFEGYIIMALKYLFDEFNAVDDVAAFNEKIAIFSELSMIRGLLWDFRDTLIKNRVEVERSILLKSIQDPRIEMAKIYDYLDHLTPSYNDFLPSLYLSAEDNPGLFQQLQSLRDSDEGLIDDPDLLLERYPLVWGMLQKPIVVNLLINWLKISDLDMNLPQKVTSVDELPVIYLSAISDFNGAMFSSELLQSLLESGRTVYYYEMQNLVGDGLSAFQLFTSLLPAGMLIIDRHGIGGSDPMPSKDVFERLDGRSIEGMTILTRECSGGVCGPSGQSSVQRLNEIFPNANVVGQEGTFGGVMYDPQARETNNMFIFHDGRGNIGSVVTAGPQIPQRLPGSVDSDAASSAANPGGIDFNAQLLNLRREGVGIDITLPQTFEDINLLPVHGLTPVIIQMIPITNANLPVFLGNTKNEVEPLAMGASR